MKNIILCVGVLLYFTAIGECFKTERSIQISGSVCHVKNAITNIVVAATLDDEDGILLLKPDVRSCIKPCEDGEVHFADVDCGIHLERRNISAGGGTIRQYGFGNFKCWRWGNGQSDLVDCCGGGRLMFYVDEEFLKNPGLMKFAKTNACKTEGHSKRYFISSGVRWLMSCCKSGAERTYLHDRLDPERCLMLAYVLLGDNGFSTSDDQRVTFRYDIVRNYKNTISTMRKGASPVTIRDQYVNQDDDVRIVLTKRAEWNYVLDVEFEGLGCQIRILQRDINDARLCGDKSFM